MRQPNSLQSAFGFYFVAAAVVPLLVFGFMADNYLTGLHIAQVERELSSHTLDIRGEADTLIRETRESLTFIGAECDKLLADDPPKVDALLRAAAASKSYFQSLFLLDRQNHVRHLGLAGSLAGQTEDYRGLDLSRHELFAQGKGPAVEAGPNGPFTPRWSEVFVSVLTGEPSISLSIPFGRGTLLGTVSLKHLGTVLEERIAQNQAIEFAIIDRHGTLVAHSRPELVLQRANLLHLHPEIVEGLASGREVAIKFHEDESLLESVRIIGESAWVVHAGMSRQVALEPLQRVRVLLLLTLSIAALISVFLAMWLARRISRPLVSLQEMAGVLTRGDYQKAVPLGGARFSEVDNLASSFRQMAETVCSREATLRESEGRFRSLVEGMGEGLIMVDRQGGVVESNPAASRILGLETGELACSGPLFRRWTTIRQDGSPFPEEEHPVQIALRDGVAVSNQLMGLQHPDGREIWVQINSRPLFLANGEIARALVTFADVSGLKAAEESLRLSKLRFQELYQQFSALLEGITDRISLLDAKLQVVWANRSPSTSCIGLEVEASGHCCYQVTFGRDELCPFCPAARCFASASAEEEEVTDPLGRTWSLRAFPVFGTGGEVRNVVMIAEDITGRRESERRHARASQLAALGELAAGVAHEINNPISGVINYAQLIVNRVEEGSREHDLARRIIKEGDRIAVIVRELLTFAREESAEVHVIAPADALNEVLALCAAALLKEGVDLQVDLPADLPKVASRSHQIQQLLLNLISNARHALAEKYPDGGADKILRISGEPAVVDGRPFVRLKIRDHGTGIPPELLEKVMNPFVTTKPAGIGTGLGLSISFEIAKKHGGSLVIASEHGSWTEVTVDLPAVTAK